MWGSIDGGITNLLAVEDTILRIQICLKKCPLLLFSASVLLWHMCYRIDNEGIFQERTAWARICIFLHSYQFHKRCWICQFVPAPVIGMEAFSLCVSSELFPLIRHTVYSRLRERRGWRSTCNWFEIWDFTRILVQSECLCREFALSVEADVVCL